jgi:lipopolysaccharide/colanic/teichoic acid biosynthesis glycosyltransferase
VVSQSTVVPHRSTASSFISMSTNWRPGTPVWRPVTTRPREGLGRFLEVAISLALLLFSFPFLPFVFLLIRFDDRGPVIYRQIRVGKHGRHFVLFKFRSMVVDAERACGPSWARPGDPRVTRIGKLLRLTRVDELPQLVNVLRGDMSLVGLRPERPHFTDQLVTAIPGYGERSVVKPGITGWAQINYPYGASVHDSRVKLSYDRYYLENRSALFDMRILLATIPVVLFGRGAR